MAYNGNLKIQERLKGKKFFGRIGKFYFPEGILWDDMSKEILLELVKTSSKETIKQHLAGEIPDPKDLLSDVSAPPKTKKLDVKKEEK